MSAPPGPGDEPAGLGPDEIVELDQLEARLRLLRGRMAARVSERWRRDLPFEELISDRWQRAARLGFGPGASIYGSGHVFGDVSVGENTWIGPFTMLDGSGGLSIGAWCSISSGVHIYTHDTVAWAVSGGRVPAERSSVSIGDNTYIGSQVVVARGVTIGDHCVVGANSFVNRDIPPYRVAVGSPCRLVGRVEIDEAGSVRLVYDAAEQTPGARRSRLRAPSDR